MGESFDTVSISVCIGERALGEERIQQEIVDENVAVKTVYVACVAAWFRVAVSVSVWNPALRTA